MPDHRRNGNEKRQNRPSRNAAARVRETGLRPLSAMSFSPPSPEAPSCATNPPPITPKTTPSKPFPNPIPDPPTLSSRLSKSQVKKETQLLELMREAERKSISYSRKYGSVSNTEVSSYEFSKKLSPAICRAFGNLHGFEGEKVFVTIWCPGERSKIVVDGFARATGIRVFVGASVEKAGKEHIHLVAVIENPEHLRELRSWQRRQNDAFAHRRSNNAPRGARIRIRRRADAIKASGYVGSARNLGGEPGTLFASHAARRGPAKATPKTNGLPDAPAVDPAISPTDSPKTSKRIDLAGHHQNASTAEIPAPAPKPPPRPHLHSAIARLRDRDHAGSHKESRREPQRIPHIFEGHAQRTPKGNNGVPTRNIVEFGRTQTRLDRRFP